MPLVQRGNVTLYDGLILTGCAIILVCSAITEGFTSPTSFSKKGTGPAIGVRRPLVVALRETKESNTDSSASSSVLSDKIEEAREEANDALASVGWSRPMTDEEMTSDDPFVQSINAGILRDVGVELDELLNPSKVVNLERDLYNLRLELAEATGLDEAEGGFDVLGKSTEECDGGGGGEAAENLRDSIKKKEKSLAVERRSVFRGWLKNVFTAQAVLSLFLSWTMCTNPKAIVGSIESYERLQLDTSVQVLGFWWWWLFIVPSLRSRRPVGQEKKALDIAFLGTPLISIISPLFTKDTPTIWLLNLVVVLGAYGYAYFIDDGDNGGDSGDKNKQPEWLKFVYKSLDFGVGRERGARK